MLAASFRDQWYIGIGYGGLEIVEESWILQLTQGPHFHKMSPEHDGIILDMDLEPWGGEVCLAYHYLASMDLLFMLFFFFLWQGS